MKTRIKNGQKVLFIGDSITDCGRRGGNKPLGEGYVKLFSDLMTIREPEKRVEIINKGISGDRTTGLKTRWTDDVLRNRPDFLSVKIGINDLHGFVFNNDETVSPKTFEATYDEILARTRKALPKCKLLLIDPFYISTEKARDTRRYTVLKILPRYINAVHRLSRRYKTRLVRTHDIFQKQLIHRDPDVFCPEPVHPNMTGHLVIAEAVYAALCK